MRITHAKRAAYARDFQITPAVAEHYDTWATALTG